MTFEVGELASGKIVEVRVSGKLTKAAYEAFVPLTERKIEEYGKVRMLVVTENFHGWDAGALWQDIKFDLKHFNHIERLALVGDSRWERGMAVFCKPFTTAKVKYFDLAELEQARAWVAAEA